MSISSESNSHACDFSSQPSYHVTYHEMKLSFTFCTHTYMTLYIQMPLCNTFILNPQALYRMWSGQNINSYVIVTGTTYLDQVDTTASAQEFHTISQDIEVIKYLKYHLKLTHYSPEDGRGFYEFSQPKYVSKDKKVMLLDKVKLLSELVVNTCVHRKMYTCKNLMFLLLQKDRLFTGPGAHHLI